MGSQNGHVWVRRVKGAQLVQGAVVGFPIVEEQAHNRMRCTAFSDGFEVPDGICGQQHRAVVGRLNQGAMLPCGVSGKGEHHDAFVAKDIPALAELRMVDCVARFKGVARVEPLIGHQIVKQSFGKATPMRQGGKFVFASGRGPALGVCKVPQAPDVVGVKVRQEDMLDFGGVDLSVRFL